MKRFFARIDRASPHKLAWMLLAMWLAYSGGALAWLHVQDPPLSYCVTPPSR